MKAIRFTFALVWAIFMVSGGGWAAAQGQAPPTGASVPMTGCEKRFDAMDANRDGALTQEEFMARPRGTAKADAGFRKRDTNGDGVLTSDEFCGGKGMGGGRAAAACQRRFNTMDANHDGVVSPEELKSPAVAAKNAATVFKRRDLNRDGVLTKDEFCGGAAGSGRGMTSPPVAQPGS